MAIKESLQTNDQIPKRKKKTEKIRKQQLKRTATNILQNSKQTLKVINYAKTKKKNNREKLLKKK